MSKILHHTETLPCTVEQAYQMFTSNDKLVKWLAPVAEVETVVGGKYELFWEPDCREQNSTLGCKVTCVVPNKLLSFDWRGPREFAHFMNVPGRLTHVCVCFYEHRIVTDVHLIHCGWGDSVEWEVAREWFFVAWERAFTKLVMAV